MPKKRRKDWSQGCWTTPGKQHLPNTRLVLMWAPRDSDSGDRTCTNSIQTKSVWRRAGGHRLLPLILPLIKTLFAIGNCWKITSMGISVTLQGETSRSELMANKQIPRDFVNVCFSGVCLVGFVCLLVFLRERKKWSWKNIWKEFRRGEIVLSKCIA